MKRIMQSFTAVSVMLIMLVSSFGASAKLGINNELQVSLMAALGIVPGYPTEYVGSDKVRAEDFYNYVYRLSGTGLSDVSAELEAGGFSADDTMMSHEAVKTTLKAIGYAKVISSFNENYFDLAQNVDLLKNTGINSNNDIELTYDDMVLLFYNALNAPVMRWNGTKYSTGDETVMEYYLKVYEAKGVVNANNTVSIDGGSLAGTDSVRIDDDVYNVGNTTASKLLGYTVKFYYVDNNGDSELKWIEPNTSKTTSIKIYGNDITEATETEITYETNNKSKTVKLDSACIIIYNSKNVSNNEITATSAASENAENTLIDSDGNGSYNILLINDYEYYYVDAITSDTYVVSDYGAGTSITLDPDKTDELYVYKDGEKKDISDIKSGDMLAVAKSLDGDYITVEMLSGTVSGEITTLSYDEVTIADTTYSLSPAYAGDSLKIGRIGTFYFDRYGWIVRCSGLKDASSQYGYLIKYYGSADPDGDYTAEIFTANNTLEKFTVKSSFNFNGVKRTAKEAAQVLQNGQLVTYNIGSEGKLTKLNTAAKSYIGVDEKANEFSLHFTGTGKYRKSNLCFNSKYLVETATPIFVIPNDGDKDDYTVIDASELSNNTVYDISVYDIDDYMIAGCIVMKENFAEPETMRSKRSVVLSKVSVGINDDDDNIIRLEGYQKGSKVTFELEDLEMKDNRGKYYVKDLKKGDVVQISADSDNVIKAVQLLMKSDEGKLAIADGTEESNSYREGGTNLMPDLWVSYGVVTSRNSTILLVDADGNDAVVSKDPHKLGNSLNVYVYENGEISVSNKNEIMIGDKVYVHEYQGNLYEVVVIR